MKMNRKLLTTTGVALALTAAVGTAIGGAGDTPSITPKTMADALHLVMDFDRAVYTKKIVNRLVKKEKVIPKSETFDAAPAMV